MKYSALTVALVLSVGLGSPASAETAKTPLRQIKACENCHGARGDSTDPYTPRLNSQPAAYLLNRLRELTDFVKETPHATNAMFNHAHTTEHLGSQIANYFANQIPTPAQPRPGKLADMGAQLVADGDLADHVLACQSCHGAGAAGLGAAPRLVGQHKKYLETQLWDLFLNLRQNSVMHPTAGKFSADQIDALTAYLGAD